MVNAEQVHAMTQDRRFKKRIVSFAALTIEQRSELGMALYRVPNGIAWSEMALSFVPDDMPPSDLSRRSINLGNQGLDDKGLPRRNLLGLVHTHPVLGFETPEELCWPTNIDLMSFVKRLMVLPNQLDGVLTTHQDLGGAVLTLMHSEQPGTEDGVMEAADMHLGAAATMGRMGINHIQLLFDPAKGELLQGADRIPELFA